MGLWEAVLCNGDATHPESRWTWSPEFRRLAGYESLAEFPNRMESWSDLLHPDDVAPTFAEFNKCILDKTGKTRLSASYRLRGKDSTYRWFRATGGCIHQADGKTIRACGSLTNIHEEMLLKENAARAAAEDQQAIGELDKGLAALAAGDLTHRITAELAVKADELKNNFNVTADALQNIIGSVSSATASMQNGSADISTASQDLSKRTEQQAAALEETTAAIANITMTVEKTAESATRVNTITAHAHKSAESSGTVVSDAVKAMSEIKQSSKEIGHIIGVIDEIAFQTSVLSLNASIEAARAGDSGKGFAVVAQEVRDLAQRSADAAKNIKSLISASTIQVEQGVALVDKAGDALRGIALQINDITSVVGEIALSTQRQSTGMRQINTAVIQMDRMTQQNAAMVEETAASSQSLAKDASHLVTLVNRFRVAS
ncbi:methyl-accepting chemotaxis protein [Asaia astilbis]|uniref:methyl-accepting chemotaxis protein n=1 Tax=Asaia astilbis TaxID=610244 RepID=UPI0004700F22|nr:PAS domain-containing methyl-accepting chemotaxis protein [Asaia astilbis]